MSDRSGIFAGDDPFALARRWLEEATAKEPNDPNAIALSTVDATGMPNVRMVLLKEIEADAFVFYTNYGSRKAQELDGAGKAAFVMHWKSLARQIRVRGWSAARTGRRRMPITSRGHCSPVWGLGVASVAAIVIACCFDGRGRKKFPETRNQPAATGVLGGYRIRPTEIEFWADGAFRLHDRFRWSRPDVGSEWEVVRLSP